MHRRLPPFTAIQAFEAAARHLSFKAAAGELCVTPSAVSHQVRALEEHLGVALFERHPTGVVLTAAGALYREDLTALLNGLDACTRRARDTDPDGPLAALLARDRAIHEPADVLRHTLIRDEIGDEWPEWFARAKIPGPVPAGGPRFAHCDLVLNAAESGLGVALVYDALAAASLAAGSLVRLFDTRTDPVLIYSLAWRRSRSDNPRIRALRDWIRAEVRTSVARQTAPAA